MAFNVANYHLPRENGNPVTNPLLWRLPPPCAVKTGATAARKAAFTQLLKHIIERRLRQDGLGYVVEDIFETKPLSECRMQTKHSYEVWFSIPEPLDVQEDSRESRTDFRAAMPMGVREVRVMDTVERLPMTADEESQRLVVVRYTVQCRHNKKSIGNARIPKADEYVRVKRNI